MDVGIGRGCRDRKDSGSTGRTMIPSPPYLLFAAAAKRQVSCLVCKKNLIEASFVGSNVVGVLDERLRECAGSVITCFGRESQSQSERGTIARRKGRNPRQAERRRGSFERECNVIHAEY